MTGRLPHSREYTLKLQLEGITIALDDPFSRELQLLTNTKARSSPRITVEVAMNNRNNTTDALVEVVLPGKVEPEGLEVRHGAVPAAGPGQVVIRMEATGVSFAEQQMRRGKYYDQPPFPFVPGYDLVGTVQSTGTGVEPGLVGTRVAALVKVGGWASHVLVDAADVVPVPEGISAAEAETVVVNGITAWQMLHRKARIRAGQTILVHGANGGVGTVLVQLAHAAGVNVIGTASPRHHDALRDQGVGSATSPRAGWTPSSITSAAQASSGPGASSPPAARSSPTAAPPPATTRAPSSCPCSRSSAGSGRGTRCPTAATPTSSTSGPGVP
jgi:hypothetical protein